MLCYIMIYYMLYVTPTGASFSGRPHGSPVHPAYPRAADGAAERDAAMLS
jgi:hypothetical protein